MIPRKRLRLRRGAAQKAAATAPFGVYGNVYISPDLSPKEREANRKLREELAARRSAGENNLTIRGGKIVSVAAGQGRAEGPRSQGDRTGVPRPPAPPVGPSSAPPSRGGGRQSQQIAGPLADANPESASLQRSNGRQSQQTLRAGGVRDAPDHRPQGAYEEVNPVITPVTPVIRGVGGGSTQRSDRGQDNQL